MFAIKYSSITFDDVSEQYLQEFKPKVYRLSRNDEFEYEAVLSNARQDLQNDVVSYSYDSMSYLTTYRVKVGVYDFEKNEFPLNFVGNSIQVYKNCLKCNSDLRKVLISFPYLDSMLKLKVNQEKAKNLIAKRKSEFGTIDRWIYLTLEYRLTDQITYDKGILTIIGEIRRINFYENENRVQGFLATLPNN